MTQQGKEFVISNVNYLTRQWFYPFWYRWDHCKVRAWQFFTLTLSIHSELVHLDFR